MLRLRVFVVLALVISLAGVGLVYGQQGMKMKLTGQDFAEIEQLYGRYNQGSDFRDVDLWMSIFSDDGVFVVGGNEFVGKAAIREWRAASFARREGPMTGRHIVSSVVVTPTADGATGVAYYFTMDMGSRPPSLGGGGVLEDVFVKTSDGWRIKKRVLTNRR